MGRCFGDLIPHDRPSPASGRGSIRIQEARRIWLNLDLIRKPYACLEYVFVHEMVHLLERNHTRRFHGLMDRFLPDWLTRRDSFNQTPLPPED